MYSIQKGILNYIPLEKVPDYYNKMLWIYLVGDTQRHKRQTHSFQEPICWCLPIGPLYSRKMCYKEYKETDDKCMRGELNLCAECTAKVEYGIGRWWMLQSNKIPFIEKKNGAMWFLLNLCFFYRIEPNWTELNCVLLREHRIQIGKDVQMEFCAKIYCNWCPDRQI